ncbi:hypothetical protein H5410_030784 [Solanum commersonii]|uniref:Uncharacterized protein n=1 Tax=Solanum commersonii TaxID=4109 RepID=A0A9J5YKD2_SOLCO|nr:hypothetical protein H5410_030784 [Solanum commersonii]
MAEFSDCINDLELVDLPLSGGSYTWRRGLGSDHNPILPSCGDWEFKKSYFKFENWWLEVEGFRERVKEWWNSFPNTGRPSYNLANKLKLLKKELTQWSKSHRLNWKKKKEGILLQISSWETLQDQRALSDDELLQKSHLPMEFKEVAKREEIAWTQRSRVKGLSDSEDIKDAAQTFYQNMYKETEHWRPRAVKMGLAR